MTSTSVWASSSRRAARSRGGTPLPATALAVVLAGLLAVRAEAGVLHAKDEALRLAFPDAEVTQHTVFLTEAQVAAVEARTGAAVDSKLFTYYEGRRQGQVVGHAVIDTHVVRTLPETFLALLAPDGTLERVILLAFYEPPEYQPSPRWLEQFQHKRPDDGAWRVGRDVHGISGATLTSHAVSESLHRIQVLWDLVLRPPPTP